MKKMLTEPIVKILGGILAVLSLLIGGLYAGYNTAPPADLSLGAVSGNEVQGNQFIVGGRKTYQYGGAFFATTTSVCFFQTPNATTTLVSASAQTTMTDANKVGATINKLGIHVGANNWASTTRVAMESIAIGNNADVVATTTWTTATGAAVTATYLRNRLIAPNSFVNYQIEGTSSPTTGGLRGNCNLELAGLE